MVMGKSILIVDDDELFSDEFFARKWKRFFGGEVELIVASSIVKAEQDFNDNKNIIAIVMDGLVFENSNSGNANAMTLDLVRKFRQTFKGPMIATSTIPRVTEWLKSRGCDYDCDKQVVIETLKEILKKLNLVS